MQSRTNLIACQVILEYNNDENIFFETQSFKKYKVFHHVCRTLFSLKMNNKWTWTFSADGDSGDGI